jgi:uncharacterized phage infection (PIP) family protein YhgE
MNDTRRKSLADIRSRIELALGELGNAKEELEDVINAEQEAFDNMPEGLQQTDRGQAMEDGLSTLDDASSTLDDSISSLEDIMGQIDEVV